MCLAAYAANPILIREHASIERALTQGGYGRRQIYELVQNGADALADSRGRLLVLLTQDVLYVANEGRPIDVAGVDSILSSHLSRKRGNEIGRFGVGFKSVLAVSRTPQFLSRSGSFGFDLERARARIGELVGDGDEVPVLRLAEPLDVHELAASDPTLTDLMTWATTIIRLPRDTADATWLSDDLATFPSEFLIFSPQVAVLELENRANETRREIRTRAAEDGVHLMADGRDQVWRVTHSTHEPSLEAARDAADLASRGALPMIWAVELGARIGRGRFWAFFPTETITTLSGIVNAPWKTNEDRQNLLTGQLNIELIDAFAEMVVSELGSLSSADDPSRHLDLLPARDSYNWADGRLGERIFELAAHSPSIPDQDGALRVPNSLRLHPLGLPRVALDAWASYAGRPRAWCHPSVESRERRPRVERLKRSEGAAEIAEWLEALAADGTAQASAAAVRTAALALQSADSSRRREILAARIVLTQSGLFLSPAAPSLFLPTGGQQSPSYVHPELGNDREAVQALRDLGVRDADTATELRLLLSAAGTSNPVDWPTFWRLAERLPSGDLKAVLDERPDVAGRLKVRTVDGAFHARVHVLLPGNVVPADGSRDAAATADLKFHANTTDHLVALDMHSEPTTTGGSAGESWFSAYLVAGRNAYQRFIEAAGSRPRQWLITFDELRGAGVARFAGPLEVLTSLSDEARALYSAQLLSHDTALATWTLSHESKRGQYPHVPFASPVVWRVRKEGRLFTSLGVRRVTDAVGPALGQFSAVLPVATCSPESAAALGLPQEENAVPAEVWQDALGRAESLSDDHKLGLLYAAAARAGVEPTAIRARVDREYRTLEPGEVVVVTDPLQLAALGSLGLAGVLAPSDEAASLLSRTWGLLRRDAVATFEIVAAPLRDESPLIDEFPPLRWRLSAEQQVVRLIRCVEIRERAVTAAGSTYTQRDFAVEGDLIYWLDERGDKALLRHLNATFLLDLSEVEIDRILERREDARRKERVAEVRRHATIPDKLLATVGADAIRRHLPTGLIETVKEEHGPLNERALAELAYAMYGSEVLREFREDLTLNGFDTPAQWAGSRSARTFVRSLGFPPDFAGRDAVNRDPWLEAQGRPNMPELHPYQRAITANVRSLIRETTQRRALLSLPTGAGKTRVIVEALIEAVVAGEIGTPILWIAQTDELCEQAVQAWAYVWRALGPDRPLRVSRLWSNNEAEPLEDAPQVVVATVAKLSHCQGQAPYAWLTRSSCVVIDEAHAAIAPTYTALLAWLGISDEGTTTALIGLTATPFRGTSEEDTVRLVRRFYARRLDDGALPGDPYQVLQEMGVLAKVMHRELPGINIELTPEELAMLAKTRLMPGTAEARLGRDRGRTRVLMESLRAHPDDWTVLVFASSVDHAETLAALLSLEGIPAAAISSRTPSAARRHFIEEFRHGRIRVLANYAVLTEGFDAPAVRAVYVARPTYSPNLYQQMIGRGLRGKLNGGKEECLIVNVKDNVAQFGEDLAFTRFEALWRLAAGDGAAAP